MEKGAAPRGRYLALLAVGALGVVYGDIGTSPLYAFRECFSGSHPVAVSPENVLGVLSLIFWSLTLLVTVKYLALVLRADNNGEGGILALMALVRPPDEVGRRRSWLVLLALFGAALLYGDGMITPAISVLSAVEGLKVAAPSLEPLVLPLTVAILVGLFLVQRHGTGRVGAVFGPLMAAWFGILALLGAGELVHHPGVLRALDPRHALHFFAHNGERGFLVLGAVVLCVTGGEALYADLGHFGRRPIRIAWFGLVYPALLLNYFGQGALVLSDPGAAANPFFHLAPEGLRLPLVALSTAATVIASQALISGAFSLTRQAVQLGFAPRVRIRHTSAREIGQIYVPEVNALLLVASVGLVLGFRTSGALAAAYGIAVTGTMVITTLLATVAARRIWNWNAWAAAGFALLFLALEGAFFAANAVKILHGGWFPILVGVIGLVLMATWRTGRWILADRMREAAMPLPLFLEGLQSTPPLRVPGTAVFLTGSSEGVPPSLLHNLRHNRVLHQHVVFLTLVTAREPRVPPDGRVKVEELAPGIHRVVARFGFMEDPDVPAVLELATRAGVEGLDDPTYFLGRETLLATQRPGMALWREALFALMSRNAVRATHAFRLPPDRVIELGAHIEL